METQPSDSNDSNLNQPPKSEPQVKNTALDLISKLLHSNPEILKALERQAAIEAAEKATKGRVPYKTGDGRIARPCGPYYKEVFGLQLKPFLDNHLINQNKPIVFNLKHFPNCSLATLYNRVNQSFLWLCNELPNEEDRLKYTALKNRVVISREKGVFIVIRFEKSFIDDAGPLHAEVLEDKSAPKEWQHEMEEFIENGEKGTVWEKKGLKLTPEEMETIRISIGTIEDLQGIVEPTRVKLLKIKRA